MTWLYEQPLVILLLGLTVAAVVAVVLLQKGQGLAILGVTAVLLMTGALLVVERLVVTDREEVEMSLQGLVAHLRDNDVDGVYSFISPDAVSIRQQAEVHMSIVTVTKAKISSLKVNVNRLTNPPTAIATFTGSLHVEVPGFGRKPPIVRRVELEMARSDDRWLVTRYHHQPWPPAPEPVER